MWVRKRLDIGWRDLAWGICRGLFPTSATALARRITAMWSVSDDALCCLSVRSGWDLLLTALDLPRGSEVLVSALTIPDMVQIIEDHGLVPVPLDVDPQRLTVNPAAVEQAITPATRLILVAHLFGARSDVGQLAAVAQRNGLLLVEDCAQAFLGFSAGGPVASRRTADVEMYSFGTIKTATALGGGVLLIRDRTLLERMQALQARWPVQGRSAYLRRLLKYSVLKCFESRLGYAMFVLGCRLLGTSHDRVVTAAVRGFAGPGFFQRIRRQPSGALLAVLERRLQTFQQHHLAARTERGQCLAACLQGIVELPGLPTLTAGPHSFWVFPIAIDSQLTVQQELIDRLAALGFDATQAQSLRVVASPDASRFPEPVAARRLLPRMIFLPCYPGMSDSALDALAVAVKQSLRAAPVTTSVQSPATIISPEHVA